MTMKDKNGHEWKVGDLAKFAHRDGICEDWNHLIFKISEVSKGALTVIMPDNSYWPDPYEKCRVVGGWGATQFIYYDRKSKIDWLATIREAAAK